MNNRLLYLFVAITTIATLLTNALTLLDTMLMLVSSGLFILIIGKYPLMANLGKYMVLWGFWMSVVFIPAFHLGMQFGLGSKEVAEYDYNVAASFGARVSFLSCVAWLIFSGKKKLTSQNITYTPKLIKTTTIYWMFLVMFLLSAFCYSTGLGKMGAETVVLPFHLGGIINLARKTLFPALFAIIIENHLLCGKKITKTYFALFFVWSIFEMITWLSKSILVMNFLPVFIVIVAYLRPSPKNIAKVAIPFFAMFMVFYPLIAAMRSADKGKSFSEYVVNAINIADEENEDAGSQSPLLAPLNRTFITFNHYTKDYSYLEKSSIFDFSKMPSLLVLGGAAGYQTFVVDGYPIGVQHSSGTSGLMDPLLHGGYGLCYLMIFVIMLFAVFIDSQHHKRQYSIMIQLLLMLYSFVLVKNISGFYDGVGVSTIISQIIVIVLAKKINYANKVAI